MGLLKNFGRSVKDGSLFDGFAEAQAALDGDYDALVRSAAAAQARRSAARRKRPDGGLDWEVKDPGGAGGMLNKAQVPASRRALDPMPGMIGKDILAGAPRLHDAAGQPAGGAEGWRGLPKIGSPWQLEALPSGADYLAPDGSVRRKR